jgi:hypothetical protein
MPEKFLSYRSVIATFVENTSLRGGLADLYELSHSIYQPVSIASKDGTAVAQCSHEADDSIRPRC